MRIKVVSPGPLTTVQDLGRRGYQRYGVPVSGACDARSARLANIICGNPEGAAVLECTVQGPALRFEDDGLIAVAGADMGPMLDGKPFANGAAAAVRAGSELSFSGLRSGLRAYIAFWGGISVPELMGSRSTYLKTATGGFEGRKLAAGDELFTEWVPRPCPYAEGRFIDGAAFEPKDVYQLRVVMGPQDDMFTEAGKNAFCYTEWTVSASHDRMGMRLEGGEVESVSGCDIISDGISMGAVQISSGQPIVMLSDRQTTGGYAKIANVITADLSTLGQLKAGDRVRFCPIDMEKAQELARRESRALEGLRIWLDNK